MIDKNSKIMIAILNQQIVEELINKDVTLVNKNIQYMEGILEFLEEDKQIDYLILNDNLLGEIQIFDLLTKVRKINPEIKVIMVSNKIYKEKNVYKILQSEEQILGLFEKENKEKNKLIKNGRTKKIISIIGDRNVGKTFVASLIYKYLENKDEAIILCNEQRKNEFEIIKEDLKENINVSFYEKIDEFELKNLDYKIILIDNSLNDCAEIKKILNLSDLIILVTASNKIGIYKTIKYLENFFDFNKSKTNFKKTKIDKKIKILFNKDEENLEKNLVINIFSNYEILETIKSESKENNETILKFKKISSYISKF